MNTTHKKSSQNSSSNMLTWLLNLFSNVWLGVALLIILFIYSSIGSAGLLYPNFSTLNLFNVDAWEIISVRQLPGFEMTEFEWFHWWPFDVLIALICLTLVVVTLRKIRFSIINLGVWMIHSGIIILALGSVWYFSTKVEGDAPVAMREIVIKVPGIPGIREVETARMLVKPGNSITVGEGNLRYSFQITEINPNWPLLTGENKGKTTYSVMVSVMGPGQTFIRQLLTGYPELTEDIIPGQGRAVKSTGKKLLDKDLELSLDYSQQDYFYIVQSDAIYLREVGNNEWIARPIKSRAIPRYHDYVASLDDVEVTDAKSKPTENAINLDLPSVDGTDALPGNDLRVMSYLRYAFLQPSFVSGGDNLNPYISFHVNSGQGGSHGEFLAFDPFRNKNEYSVFKWIQDESELDKFQEITPGTITVVVPESEVTKVISLDDLDFSTPEQPYISIEGTDYQIRIRGAYDQFQVREDLPPTQLTIIDIKTSDREFNRWVFGDSHLNRDQISDETTGESSMIQLDEGIDISFQPGKQPAVITIVGGPAEDQLRLLVLQADGKTVNTFDTSVGLSVEIMQGITFETHDYFTHAREVTKPTIVPISQRRAGLDMLMKMLQVEVPGNVNNEPVWLEYHQYPFRSENETLRRNIYKPTRIKLTDGREIELVYSRRRMKLPAPVVLENFELVSHEGGYTGNNTSVMDWRSIVRFQEDTDWGDTRVVAVNKPTEFEGFWFFQSAWDPPDADRGPGNPASLGNNYTVLGVGNREGVYVQLLGCTIAVIGMIYAFYVKPVLKRRKQSAVYANVKASSKKQTIKKELEEVAV